MQHQNCAKHPEIRDYGGEPFVFNIRHAAEMNRNFRTTLWTGEHLQLTLMSIPAGGEIGIEMHENVDQFLCVESGRARVFFGECRHSLTEKACADAGSAIFIPAGTWHNLVNAGSRPLKLYSLYAPPQHKPGTMHPTKADADLAEH